MKKEYYNFGDILKTIKFKIYPRGFSETFADIEYLLKRYLQSRDLQFLISNFQFIKYHDFLEKEIKDIIPLYTVKIVYPYVLVKSIFSDQYEKAIIISESCRSAALKVYFKTI